MTTYICYAGFLCLVISGVVPLIMTLKLAAYIRKQISIN